LSPAGEVDATAADGQVDVARHGVSDVHVRDAAGEAIDEVAGIAAGSDDVAEVHHHLYRGACEPVGEFLCAFEIPTEPVEVKGLGPDLDAVARSLLGGARQFPRHQVEVVVERFERLVIKRAAGQHERVRTGRRRQRKEHLEVTVAGGAAVGVQRAVEVADVTVDRTNTDAGGAHGVGNGVDGIAVEHVRNVVADSGQGAEIDFGEPECPDPGECGFEGEVSKADRRAAEAAVNHFQVLASSVVTTTTLTQSTVNSQLIAEGLC